MRTGQSPPGPRRRTRRPVLRTLLTLAVAAVGLHAGPATAATGTTTTADAPGAAAQTWTVTGPSGTSAVAARVTLADAGTLSFAVDRGGAAVLSPSPIGIRTSAADLTRDLSFVRRADRTVTESYTQPTGRQREHRTVYTETTLSFTGTGGTPLDIVVRASDNGAAYRYVLGGSGQVTITGEASSWNVPGSATAWLVPPHSEDQGQWFQTTAGGAPANNYAVPALFEVNGVFALLAETDLDGRYSGARLAHQAGSGTYTTVLHDSSVTATRPFATPWRTAAVGSLGSVTSSTLVNDLAPPSRVQDTSWVRPGAVAWSWLTEHASPRDPARQREYIDFARRNGWEYVLIDEGWDQSWTPGVVDYARQRGVGVILWFHSDNLDTAQERANWLPLVRSWGVAGLKIDFAFEFDRQTLQWYDAILAETAAQRLMVNFHGSGTPRGMQRTWPHVMTAEAVYGAEQQRNRAALNTMLPFTRNVVSSMDYTPVTFSVTNRDTTDAHEVATALVFESGWQHLADNPETYQLRPPALRVLNQLPTAWDESRLLDGRPGRDAYVARRAGQNWYVGGISATDARTFTTPLGFLGSGSWLVETLRDGTGGLVVETRTVTSGSTLSVPVATRGGFLSVICPATAGRTSCGTDHGGLLRGAGSGLCADVPGLARDPGTEIALWSCNGGANQVWTPDTRGALTVYGDRCLEPAGTGTGASVRIQDCTGAAAQVWQRGSNGSLVHQATGQCLDAYDRGTVNGTRIIVWPCNGADNQSWTLG